ncbi:MAG TPA: hypothetical protein PLZ57_01820 [Pseudobdellovibrionaceae bacterium]|nr:hypothetical protein [Pseudobdellovibrionaceae bacterium]
MHWREVRRLPSRLMTFSPVVDHAAPALTRPLSLFVGLLLAVATQASWFNSIAHAQGFVPTRTQPGLPGLTHPWSSAAAPSVDADGPYVTQNTEYKLRPSVDADVLPGVTTEVWARVFWPENVPAQKKLPMLFFLHGNHSTCGRGTAPREDSSCEYTHEGTCPAGMVVVPNHDGYNYVARHLASWGYVVVSINANRGITCSGGDSEDWGLVLARGRLVLKHLQLWTQWSQQGGAPTELTSMQPLLPRLDFSNVGLMGHSRGGEGVRAAYNLYRDPQSPWVAKIPQLKVKGIFEIGAVDGQSDRVLDAKGTAWSQLLPLCDGDVSDLQGRMPFERMAKALFNTQLPSAERDEDQASPKTLQHVWGANHNFFNTEWQSNDSYGCLHEPQHRPLFGQQHFSVEQQSVGLQSMSAFFRAHVGEDRQENLAQTFDPQFGLPSSLQKLTRIDRDFISALDSAQYLVLDNFTAATGQSSSGAANEASGVDIEHNTDDEPSAARISWRQASEGNFMQSNWTPLGQGRDLRQTQWLEMRVSRDVFQSPLDLNQAVNFTVQLADSQGRLSGGVELAEFSQLHGPANDNARVMQTARIPMAALIAASTGRQFDLSQVRGVRLTFNKNTPGSHASTIYVTQIRFTQPQSGLARPSGNPALDLAIPPSARTLTPYRLSPFTPIGPRAPRRTASWVTSRWVSKSRYLRGEDALEVAVRADQRFDVMSEIPVLNLANQFFRVSRYPSSGKTDVLIFSIPRQDVLRLPSHGTAQVQYGERSASRIWVLPNFQKSQFGM